ncbi:hypothetical protein [Nocardia callitridis]|uniref:Uncharacterized protein n=1 Tax=Nocardia callitridis TaxID=648753 RepID=A0ABP9KJG8_9NOCA
MSEENPPRPLANLIDEAHEGRLLVRMDPEQFVRVDRDCEFFKNAIRDIQQKMIEIAQQDEWGLGEKYTNDEGKELVSGKTMVHRYRTKAQGTQNGVYEVLESHFQVVEDFQNVFREIRTRYSEQDDGWAARYQNLEQTMPPEPPAPPKYFMRFTSTGGA